MLLSMVLIHTSITTVRSREVSVHKHAVALQDCLWYICTERLGTPLSISGSSSHCGKLPTWEQKDFIPPQNLIAETQAQLDCFSIPHSFAERSTYSAKDLYLFIHLFILKFLFFALLPHYLPVITNVQWILQIKQTALFFIYLLKISTVFWNGPSLK